MTAIEAQLIISVATIVTTISGGGVIAAVVAHKLSSARAEREFERRKLEELFVAVHRYCTKLFAANIVWPRVMRGEIDYNQGLDIFIKNHSKKDENHETAIMIINIYFPKLRQAFDGILHRRDRINNIKSDFKATYLRGNNCGSFERPFLDELKAIDADEKKFMDELFQISRSLK